MFNYLVEKYGLDYNKRNYEGLKPIVVLNIYNNMEYVNKIENYIVSCERIKNIKTFLGNICH